MKIVLLGAPGAGKGSQAELITKEYGIPHISTGDAFRSNIKAGTEIGLYAKSFMDKGLLVPDEVTVKIVEARLSQGDCASGFMLDGFPRSLVQAEFLDKITALDCVLNISVPFDVILKRLSGRRSCSCGAIYNTDSHKSDSCLKCGNTLFIRDDDKEEAIKKRLEVYQAITAPLVDYYAQKGILSTVIGAETILDTFSLVKNTLDLVWKKG
ncbi:MAG: adenylate kinase [Christensenellaceae bacterium]|jgi:adenylate kinase|nr:adenylate kinase [Christensenellaceae bacterium]